VATKNTCDQRSSGINQFNNLHVRKVADQSSIMIRLKILFKNYFFDQVDMMAAADMITAPTSWKFYDSVPQQPALEHAAYASYLDFLWYRCQPPATDERISLFHAKHRSLTDWHKTKT
jgi:hypothetical protein